MKNPIRGVELFIYYKLINNHVNNNNCTPLRNTSTYQVNWCVGENYTDKCKCLSKNFNIVRKYNYYAFCLKLF